jgi:hypothetical protein
MSKTVSVIVSHSNRIQHDLVNFFDVRYKAKNCCILRLSIKNNQVTIDEIYDGNKMQQENGKYGRNLKTKTLNTDEMYDLMGNYKNIPDHEYVFYLIRHAEGEHNVSVFNKFKKDPVLTERGIDQASRAGKALGDFLFDKKETVDYYFVSILHRTPETLLHLFHGMNEMKTAMKITPVVLPGAEEFSLISIGNENVSACYPENIRDPPCKQLKGKDAVLNLDWKFYNGLKWKVVINEERLDTSNMFRFAMFYIDKYVARRMINIDTGSVSYLDTPILPKSRATRATTTRKTAKNKSKEKGGKSTKRKTKTRSIK